MADTVSREPDQYGFTYPPAYYAQSGSTSSQKKKHQRLRRSYRIRRYKKILSGMTKRPALFAATYQRFYQAEGDVVRRVLRRVLDRGNSAVTDKRAAS